MAKISELDMTERADTLREVPIRPGYWLARVHLKAPQMPAMIERCCHEPGNAHNRMDRSYWIAAIAGQECDPYEVIACKDRTPITAAEYRFLCAERAWATEWAPEDPAALHPRREADLTKLPPIEP